VLVHYLGKQKAENSEDCVIPLNTEYCLSNSHTKHIYIITWPELNHTSFLQESAVCTKQDLGKEYSMLPSVTTH